MDILRNDDLVRIEVDAARSLVITEWKGYVPSPDYRAILMQLLDAVNDNKVRLWLSISTHMGIILRSDERWSIEVFTPMLMEAGLCRVAVVRSADFFSQTASERMVDATADYVPYKVEFFNSVEKADGWLMQEMKTLTK